MDIGSTVAVIGLGMIGMACVWAAAREGARVVYAADVDSQRARNAELLAPPGRIVGIDSRGSSLSAELARRGAEPVDAVIDAAGLSVTVGDAVRATRPGGNVSLVGMATPNLDLSAYEITTQQRSILGSFCYSEQVFAECADLIARGEVDRSAFVDSVITLDEAPATFHALATAQQSSIKTFVLPQGQP